MLTDVPSPLLLKDTEFTKLQYVTQLDLSCDNVTTIMQLLIIIVIFLIMEF